MNMPTLIRDIIEQEEAPYKAYRDYQRERLEFLRSLRTLSKEEQESERQQIITLWQEIGILDENGELSENYTRGENE